MNRALLMGVFVLAVIGMGLAGDLPQAMAGGYGWYEGAAYGGCCGSYVSYDPCCGYGYGYGYAGCLGWRPRLFYGAWGWPRGWGRCGWGYLGCCGYSGWYVGSVGCCGYVDSSCCGVESGVIAEQEAGKPAAAKEPTPAPKEPAAAPKESAPRAQEPAPAAKEAAPKPQEPAAPAKPAPSFPAPALETPPPPAPEPPKPAAAPGNSAMLNVRVPADAIVIVNEHPTTSTGTLRRYVSRGLDPGLTYRFEIRAEVRRGGTPVSRTKVVDLKADQSADVVFDFQAAQVASLAR